MRPTSVSLRNDRSVSHLQPSRSGPYQFRFSLAGAQWKLSARSVDRGLTTNANVEGVEYIAKFHSPEFPGLPRCEFATMNWAKCSGMVVPDFELRSVNDFDAIPEEMPTGDGDVFVCRRFDRESNRRIHMEDFGQILDRPAGHDQYNGCYEEIASVLSWLAPDCVEELLKVITFCIISGNGDAHLKNFSVQYKEGRVATLSPAYDLVATIAFYPLGREKLALKLGGSEQFESFALHRFTSLFQRVGWEYKKGCKLVRSYADQVISAWNSNDIRHCFAQPHRERIEQHVNSMRSGFAKE
jgi:serine/threonine-protein kinase HipA